MSHKSVVLSLSLFLALSPVAVPEIEELVYVNSETGEETSHSTGSQELSLNTKGRSRSLSRFLRGELSGKLFSRLSARPDQLASVAWTKQTYLFLSLSKQDLYQQIRVYRI